MPVDFINPKNPPRRLRFVRNTSYQGTDFGPDYPQQECDVDAASAFRFISGARAVEVKSEPPGGSPVGQAQHRDPQPTNRDPVVTESAPAPDLRKLKKPALIALAQSRGISLTDFQTKAEIIESIEAADLK